MEAQKMIEMLRDCLSSFEENMHDNGYGGSEQVDVGECADDFMAIVSDRVQDAIADDERFG